jgi:uncharacterized protein (TIGR02117 family)
MGYLINITDQQVPGQSLHPIPMLKQTWSRVKRLARVSAIGGLGVTTLLAIAALTPRQWATSPPPVGCDLPIYISGDGMHTNIWIPVRSPVFDWNQHLGRVGKQPLNTHRYLQFGWGDRRFYMETPSWSEVRPTQALRALFAPANASALLVKGHSALPASPPETLRCINLSPEDYLALMTFLQASFERDSQGNLQRLGSGQDGDSSFYAATGHYSILRTCNSWTADGLRAAHVNTPVWGGLAPAVMHHLSDSCTCR